MKNLPTRRDLGLLLAAATSLPLHAAPDLYTGGLLNGRLWQTLTSSKRALWLLTTFDTVRTVTELLGEQSMMYRTAEKMFYLKAPKAGSQKDLIDKITYVYQDPVNLAIPIINVYSLACQQFNGLLDDAQFHKDLSEQRRVALEE